MEIPICPQCGSQNTRRLSLIYLQGTADVAGLAFFMGMKGNYGLVPTYARKTSRLAQLAAPPLKKSWGGFAFLWFFGSLLLCFGVGVFVSATIPDIGDQILFWSMYVGWPLMFLIGVWSRRRAALHYNRNVWPILYEVWQRSYLCGRCGTVFEAG
jgi:hypothetical protein